MAQIQNFFVSSNDLGSIRAETLFTNFLVEHNVPLSVADHFGPLLKKMCPDSEIAKKYACARTKTGSIVRTLADDDERTIREAMKNGPFSIATDGSTDYDDVKLYPLVVRYFDDGMKRVVCVLLRLAESRVSTGEAIFKLIDEEFDRSCISWSQCVSFGADNANVMRGLGKGVAGFLINQHPHVYMLGCPCHLIHLAAEKAARQLTVKVEDMLVMVYYYLDKSSKRKSLLKDVQVMCQVEVRKILKQASTRWLSLGQCVRRLIEQWQALELYFQKEANACSKPTDLQQQTRASSASSSVESSSPAEPVKKKGFDLAGYLFQQQQLAEKKKKTEPETSPKPLTKPEIIYSFLADPMSKVYALFLKRATPLFDKANLMLQKDEPCIHILHATLEMQLQDILVCFIKPVVVTSIMKHVVKGAGHVSDRFKDRKNQLDRGDLVIGQDTKQLIAKHPGLHLSQFYKDVRNFFVAAVDYMLLKFPFGDELLVNAAVADVNRREIATFSQVTYFTKRYECLHPCDMDTVEAEFLAFQVSALPTLSTRVDEAWCQLEALRSPDGSLRFQSLAKIMKGILVIFHSNSDCERVFSLVTKNKTEQRASMKTPTLSALVTRKVSMQARGVVCHREDFPDETLRKAKRSTNCANLGISASSEKLLCCNTWHYKL